MFCLKIPEMRNQILAIFLLIPWFIEWVTYSLKWMKKFCQIFLIYYHNSLRGFNIYSGTKKRIFVLLEFLILVQFEEALQKDPWQWQTFLEHSHLQILLIYSNSKVKILEKCCLIQLICWDHQMDFILVELFCRYIFWGPIIYACNHYF